MSKNVFGFVLGAAVGALAAWSYAKQYYEHVIDDEVESVKEYYNEKIKGVEADNSSKEDTAESEDKIDEHVKQDGVEITIPGIEERAKEENPVIIPIEEFGYSRLTVTWSYFTDGVVLDDMGEVVPEEEWKESLGTEWRGIVDSTSESAVYVRNSKRQCDYEIIIEDSSYEEYLA